MTMPTETPGSRVQVTSDPLAAMPVGASISFTTLGPMCIEGISATAQSVKNWGAFEGALLSVHIGDDSQSEGLGSAALIAPGLAVTAQHVFEGYDARAQAGEVHSFCVGHRQDGADFWRVTHVVSMDDTDIAFLYLELASAMPPDGFHQFGVTTRSPRVGELLTIVGFRFETGTRNVSPLLAGVLLESQGRVEEVSVDDNGGWLPFPYVQVACGTRGGMSGGAVFDEHLRLVGVLSKGLTTHDGTGPSVAAWMLAAFNTELAVPWPPGLHPQGESMVCLPAIDIERRDAIWSTGPNEFNYSVWSEEESR